MAIQRGAIFDADGHVIEGDLREFLPAPYTGKGRQGVGGRGTFPMADVLHNEPVQLLPGAHNAAGPKEWVQFLDDVGVERTVLYPSIGLGIGNASNRDWASALCRAYNDWLHQTYLKANPRFKGMALIPMQDVEEAVKELRRSVTGLGMLGAVLPANGLSSNVGAKHFWPIYAEAERLGCCLAVHGGPHHRLGLDTLETYPPVHALGHPFALLVQCAGLIFNGVFDRFPRLRVAFLEGGVTWLLLAMERFDRSYDTHVPYNPRGELLQLPKGMKVSGYIRKLIDEGRFFAGCEGEEPMIHQAVEELGRKAFVFSSDYPHEVNAQMCSHEIEEVLSHRKLDEAAKDGILRENALRLYALS